MDSIAKIVLGMHERRDGTPWLVTEVRRPRVMADRFRAQ